MKRIIFLSLALLVSVTVNAFANGEKALSDSLTVPLTKQYYQSNSYLDYQYDYDKFVSGKRLKKRSIQLYPLSVIPAGTILISNSAIAAAKNWTWQLLIDIPVASVLTVASIAPCILGGIFMNRRANRLLEEYYGDKQTDTRALVDMINGTLQNLSSNFGSGSWQYADGLLWSAMLCAEYGDSKQAEDLMERSLDLFKERGIGKFEGRDSVQQMFLMDLQSVLLKNAGMDFDALQHKKRVSELKKEYFGEGSEVYLQSLLDISKLYAEMLNPSKSNYYHQQAKIPYVKKLTTEFSNQSESGRAMYWLRASRYINRTVDLAYMTSGKYSTGSDKIAGSAYDALLLRKGILLNTTMEFERCIMNSGNPEAKRHLAEKKLMAEAGCSETSLDSMDFVILSEIKAKGQSVEFPHLSITWEDVRDRLSDDDLAVEFFCSTEGYGALLLKKNWRTPKVVKLPEFCGSGKNRTPVDSMLNNSLFESMDFSNAQFEKLWSLSKAIWTDELVRHFPQNRQGRVLFSPDGLQQIVGIEYLPVLKPHFTKSGSLEYHSFSDVYNMCRLSSTRELVLENISPGKDAVIYGGLDYGMTPDEMAKDTHKYNPNRGGSRINREYVADAWSELPGTKDEAISIGEIINEIDPDIIKADIYLGKQGTESLFKSFSGQNKRIVHIATHGFNDTMLMQSEDPLEQNGLCFAGANNWMAVDEHSDDGILTAKEASHLDLSGLSLIALSACETGLGSISADGVMGLQRGFKMAGANSIMMSLWKVDDEATDVLMKEFYRNLMEGKSKQASLNAARQLLRSNEKWCSPNYWASFILLDAIDD